MIGLIKIDPSSLHKAGGVRIARAAIRKVDETPQEAITFYNFLPAPTKATVLLDFATNDTRLKDAFTRAPVAGLKYTFRSVVNVSAVHPKTIRPELKGVNNQV